MARPVVFYSPHADDETLNMGITIAEHVAAGRPTHVVLMTHGRVTGALAAINGTTASGYWKATHNPALENYSPLTAEQLAEARMHEFHNACGQLGVPASTRHVHDLDNPSSGDTLTYDEAKSVIQSYITQFPDADHYTLSDHDIHPDHAACGQALRDLYNAGAIQYNVRFVISMATRNDYESKGTTIPGGGWKDTPTDATITQRVINACRCYAAWSPNTGAYAVGYHSVAGQFDKLLANPFHYLHYVNQ
ncbi:N-acetylglucosaminyl deacetylase, LmbE family [Seinonella peptonophila]|uniref:N-acetylglucosaminyl deacetylase, LmbE family n=1 Tax=Seinonella peptonophila TaxID=112248 RepID=A0A1M4Z8G6_9BACL|nr:PIG-L family deacetylase [Seinonella peptonophila]SHF14052.1 N-acetylglucosaminyl deacetylase, LmbE family [Seinonella peptonophila]